MYRLTGLTVFCLMIGLIFSGCVASRSISYEGMPTAQSYNPDPIPVRPADQEKIPVGIIIGIDNETVNTYPRLKENDIGLGLDALMNEQLLESGWFDIVAVDPELIKQFTLLKDFYWHGNIPQDKKKKSAKPEYIIVVKVTRVVPLDKETTLVASKKTESILEVKLNFEVTPLTADTATLQSSIPAIGTLQVIKTDNIFSKGELIMSSPFGVTTERAIRDGLPKLIRQF